MFIRIPSPQQSNSRSARQSCPLTPPSVTPPSVSAQTSCATQPAQSTSAKATTLLSKVVMSPASPKRCNTESNIRTVCSEKEVQRPSNERRYSDGQEAMKYWSGHSQRDGYVSFPDFEYFEDYSGYASQDPQREGIKT